MFPGYTLAEPLNSGQRYGWKMAYSVFILRNTSDLQQGKQGYAFAHMLFILLGFPYSGRVLDFDMYLIDHG